MKKKLIIGGVISLMVIILGGFAVYKFTSGKPKTAEMPMPTVKAEKGTVEKVVFAKGVIAECQREEVKSEVRAKINQVLVKEGDQVKAGDLLFTMDEGDLKLSREQEELAYQAKLRELQKASAAADTDLVKAPSTGVATKLLVKEGDKVEENTVIAEIHNPAVLEVTAPFGPMGIEQIKVGQKARVFLVDNLAYLDGRVTKVDKRGKAEKGGGIAHEVTVRFPNPGGVMLGNMASLEILPGNGTNKPSLTAGEIKNTETQKVKAGANGTILDLEVKEGDNVKANSILARMDISESLIAVKDSQLALRQAQLSKELKGKELVKYQVRAAQDGIISEINVVAGQEPPMDKPALVISNVQGLELKAKVEELDIPFLKVDQQASVYANAFGERRFAGVITELANQGKSEGTSVMFETKIRITDPGPLKVGMTGDVDIVVERKENTLRLPTTAVTIEGKKGTVMVAGPGVPKPREVKLGLEGDEYIEIISGLKPGEQVLVNPNGVQQNIR